jgi:uncharacterized membrane protein YgcG
LVLRSLLLVTLSGWSACAQAAEEILDYHSDIVIAEDGSMTVTETIEVRAEGDQIRRGIFRDFPTDYKDRFGNDYKVDFRVQQVSRNGNPEPWRSERRANGVRVYIGDSDRSVDPGRHSYQIRYRTTRQLGFFPDHDELYWNVTGNGWMFPILNASASVRLPPEVPLNEVGIVGYTGSLGSTVRNAVAGVSDAGAWIKTTARLGPTEGLTMVVSWPKGFVAEPSRADQLRFLLADNIGLLLALGGLIGVLVYLSSVWSRYGRDPRPGVIFPQYEPPPGISPASARFINRMSYDDEVFTAAVINLAVKGHLRITEQDKVYTLIHSRGTQELAAGEQVLLDALFSEALTIELKPENHAAIGAARKAHASALRRDYQKLYFVTNSPLLLPSGAALAALAAGLLVTGKMSPMALAVILIAVAAHIAFYFLLRAPTPAGRKLMDRLDGFRMYLDVAEKDDLALRNPPQKTPALFERYLPYALALGVEQAWARQFAQVFAGVEPGTTTAYRPAWYGGRFDAGRLDRFSSSVGGALTSAISSAATPPGSSSGSGGGGFSGGGGGGGGGGGW